MIILQLYHKWFWAFCFVFVGPDVCRSDVNLVRVADSFASIEIVGRITRADVEKFATLVTAIRPTVGIISVHLESPGGDVVAAMEIGETVRKGWLWTTVPDEPSAKGCMSACVLVLAAGAQRIVGDGSRVGIHRPYFDPIFFAGLDRVQAKEKYDALSRSVAVYLAKMGMSERLHQEMMKVPSGGNRLLSYDEMRAFNLSGEDAGYSEWVRAKNVAKFGEAKMKEHDAWSAREKDYVARCTSGTIGFDEKLSLRCHEEFSARFPNPLRK